jgi:hypothetical protein
MTSYHGRWLGYARRTESSREEMRSNRPAVGLKKNFVAEVALIEKRFEPCRRYSYIKHTSHTGKGWRANEL